MPHRCQHREQLPRTFGVVEGRERHRRPERGMRVLAAVLAHAGNVALDVARRRPRRVERRIEQLHDAGVGVHEMRMEGVHRAPGALGRRRAREHRPALRDRVDPALGVACRAERRAVVEPGTAVPGAVPRGGFDAPGKRLRFALALRGETCVGARPRQRRVALQHRNQEEREPDALALAAGADEVHAVVPVARSHERQAMDAPAERVPDGAHAVLVEARGLLRDLRRLVDRSLAFADGAAFEKRATRIEHARVARHLDVARDRQRQPEVVVGTARADAFARRRVPPVLNVAFDELSCRRAQQVLAGELGCGVHERHHVLQLVAKAERTARLVERRPPPEARGQQLVEQPAVGERIDCRIGSAHVDGAQDAVPMAARGRERIVRGVASAPAEHAVARLVRGSAGAEPEHDLAFGPGREIDLDAKRGARIETGADASGERAPRERRPVRRASRAGRRNRRGRRRRRTRRCPSRRRRTPSGPRSRRCRRCARRARRSRRRPRSRPASASSRARRRAPIRRTPSPRAAGRGRSGCAASARRT